MGGRVKAVAEGFGYVWVGGSELDVLEWEEIEVVGLLEVVVVITNVLERQCVRERWDGVGQYFVENNYMQSR